MSAEVAARHGAGSSRVLSWAATRRGRSQEHRGDQGHQPPELFSFECRGVSNQYNSRCCLFIFRKVWTSCQQIVTNLTFFNFQNIMRVSARDRAVCSVVRAATNCRVIVLVFDT